MTAPVDILLNRLEGVWTSGDGWVARCPAHDDHNASLSISEGTDERVLIHCHAGCDSGAVVRAAGLTWSDLFRAKASRRSLHKTYDYTDEDGNLLFQCVRMLPKGFRQRQPDGSGSWEWHLNGVRLVPYRLPRVVEAVSQGRAVFIAEGEKDVQALEDRGLYATCNPMGASAWRRIYNEYFVGAFVVILPDNDQAGKLHAQEVARSIYRVADTIHIVHLPGLPEGGDPYDWLTDGGTVSELRQLVQQSVPYRTTTDWLRRAHQELPESPFRRELGQYLDNGHSKDTSLQRT